MFGVEIFLEFALVCKSTIPTLLIFSSHSFGILGRTVLLNEQNDKKLI